MRSTLVAFPDPRKAREEASTWLARLDRGLTDAERAQLREWLKDPVNKKAFLEMGRLWRGLDAVSVLSELFPLTPEVLNPAPRRSFSGIALAAVAAACIAVVTTLLLSGSSPWTDGSKVPRPAVYSNTYRTDIGATRVANLADGSTITLNTGTRVTAAYSLQARDVYLSYGEASFDVAHERQRPFNVHAGKRTLQAAGTRFNVRVLSPDEVEVTVTEGRVKVLAPPRRRPATPARLREEFLSGETTVNALEAALIEPVSQSVRRLEVGEIEARIAWQRGMLIFQGEPLEQVIAEMGRYSATPIVLGDENLRTVHVEGYFRAGDVEGLLVGLRESFGIHSRRDPQGRVVLVPAPRT